MHAQLMSAVEALASSDEWMQMLRAAARFPTYSPSNVLLINAQRSTATRVAGFRTWTQLGRHVVKGEKGIAILTPCTYGPRATSAENAPPAHARGSDAVGADGLGPGDTDQAPRRVLAGFRIVHVFDLSQTDGKPLPDGAPALLQGAAPAHLWDTLASLTGDAGYGLERGDCAGANGSTSFATRTVRVRADVAPAQAAKTLAHELGHIRADHEHRLVDYHQDALCRGRAEVEAESIAYLVATGAGMDTTGYTVPYVAGWAGGDPQVLRESATQVLTVARGIVADLEAASGMGERTPAVTLSVVPVTTSTHHPYPAEVPTHPQNPVFGLR
ncbi:ArdC-like ssDNA-binding domain-containing protein [Sanguibacter gelidistatuariae]|uniref:ArdC-like ssDNA-binding domain-containing protein n=1 Tax=Sanguibacter gelidistatuariae TaxID=1814289 RepID=UPI001588104F|nr:ArdC-like ssDNA-binding domain-containing protein [Sanguibacter gelidistatuariae]